MNKIILALIIALGNDSYTVREKAAKELIEIGRPALVILQENYSNPDPEIRYRVKYIHDHFYREAVFNIPQIWCLNREIRYKNGEDVAASYYIKVFIKKYGRWPQYDWNYQEIAEQAMIMMIEDSLKEGDERLAIGLAKSKALKDERNHAEMQHALISTMEYCEEMLPEPPPPIEERLSVLEALLKLPGF